MNFLKKLYSIFSGPANLDYQPNDPTTPILIRKVAVPPLPSPCPSFSVHGWNGMGAPAGSLEAQASEVYITMVNSLTLVNRLLQIPVGNWSGTHNLVAFPRAGRQFNAYYDRSSLRFFFDRNPATNKMVYTCESADIVSHELWHGVLDSLRPDLWGVQSLELFAFHESFADIGSILTALSHDEVIDYVIRETGGNLKNSNIVSRLAEEMGAAIYAKTGGMGRPADALRNAVNDFSYSFPERLPTNGPDNVLNGEPHNFSRVFTGAFYDMLSILYQKHVQTMPPIDALRTARDLAGRTILNAARIAATTPRFFASMVRAMILVDHNFGSQCHDAIMSAFTNRRIYQEIPMAVKPTAMKMNYMKDTKMFNFGSGSAVRIGGVKTLKMADQAIIQSGNNPLYNLMIDVPMDHYLEYDNSNKLKVEIPVNKEEVLSCAKHALDYLHEKKLASADEEVDSEWRIADQRLVRNHIACQCCSKLTKHESCN